MVNQFKLRFVSNEAEESQGMSDSGIETFRGSPYASTARECGQNSADAFKEKPVEIDFDHIEISASELPALDQYKRTVSLCLKKAEVLNDTKAIEFFTHAQKVLGRERIQILEISDLNTKGLVGPSEEGKPFHSLLKGSGVSVKESDTAGGSFGIGKNAVFAISELQTVFYSTIYQDPVSKTKTFLAQGKSIFISHQDEKNDPKRSVGYWGRDNFKPVSDAGSIPGWLNREEVGTSIYAVGFKVSKDWHHRMAASLLTNFFSAILSEDMKFSLNNGEILINSETIMDLFNDHKIVKAAEESNKLEALEFSKSLLECLTSEKTIEKILNINGLGKISIRILIRDKLEKRIAIIRNGMMITDGLGNFGDRFARFSLYSDFVALVEPLDEAGKSMIRKLENPSHNELSSERITDDEQRLTANKVMKNLARQIREAIKEETLTKPEDEVELDELSEFFADSDDSDKLPDPEAETNPETYSYSPPRKPKKKSQVVPVPVEAEGEEGGAGGKNDSEGGGGDGQGEGTGEGTGGKGNKRFALPVGLEEFRNLLVSGSGFHKRRIFFTPDETCTATVRISASGIAYSDDLVVVKSEKGNIENGGFTIDLQAGEREKIDVEFAEQYEGPIEIMAVKHQEEVQYENN